MNPALIGQFVGAFAFSLGIAAIWLIIAYVIPPLRRRPEGTYITAMILAVLPQLVTYGGPSTHNFIAAIVCVALLVFQMKRAKKKLAEKNISNNEQQP